jgi:pyruvate carboxylase
MPFTPGYGFLSENPEFVEACNREGRHLRGPHARDHAHARQQGGGAQSSYFGEVPVMPATPPLPADIESCKKQAAQVGYPVMLKASWGGGGRGHARHRKRCAADRTAARRAPRSQAGFGNDEVYLEKLSPQGAAHRSADLGDTHGNLVHLFERDCTVQRRNQKVVERAPAAFLTDAQRAELCGYALQIGRAVKYRNAGTVEFLQDAETGKFYFIEVNPRIQVEHTVTEAVTNIDLVKAQIRIADGAKIGEEASGVPKQEDIHLTRTRCSVASPRKIPRTASHPTTARSRPIVRRRASAFASMPAPPTRARSSRVRTTRCW